LITESQNILITGIKKIKQINQTSSDD